jgi:hypothetical protein
MTHTVVTVELESKTRRDLALPLNVPNETLSAALAQALDLPGRGQGRFLLAVKTEDGIVRISPTSTLADAGVLDGFIMHLHRAEGELNRAQLLTSAYLQLASGETFPLDLDRILLGRQDVKRNILVDIDLSPYDPSKGISRKHTLIERKQNEYIIEDANSANGTKVNGIKLQPGQKRSLQDGDVIELGRHIVELTFHCR